MLKYKISPSNVVACQMSLFTYFKLKEPYGLPWWLSGKESTCQCRRCGFEPWAGKLPWRRKGNPLQYSFPGNLMNRGAWWATVHGVTKESDNLMTKQQEQN